MRMLAQIDGVGPIKAQAVVEVFPTPSSLKSVVDRDRHRARMELQVIRTAAETQARSVGPSASDKILEALFPVAD
jgi:crossover junction endonuclease MUS81